MITRIFRSLIRLGLCGLSLFLVTYLAVLSWASLWPARTDFSGLSAQIICLGAGMEPDGILHVSSTNRVESCVDLAKRLPGARVVFSGGLAKTNGQSAGAQMADYAVSLGLPRAAALVEPKAQSTLQNALFSLTLLGNPKHVTIVTEPFHLPRSWLSFRWAGATHVDMVASQSGRRDVSMLTRETLAIWFNLARMPLYALAESLGYEQAIDLLH